MKNSPAFLLALGTLLVAGAAPARAAWPKLPTDILPVNTSGRNVFGGAPSVSDDAGGMILVWVELPDWAAGSVSHLSATHVLASGTVDPAWPSVAVELCATASWSDAKPAIVSDGAGGALVTWEDNRSGVPDIYATRVTSSGAIAPGWPAGGVAICTAAADQLVPTIVPDGAGGAVIAWQDGRALYDIYAQHLLSTGGVDPAWPVNGRALCTATDGQGSQCMVSDGAGGAIVAWMDFRTHTNWDIYAQRVLASGAVDPAWPVNGRALSTAVSHQDTPAAVSDGAGGAIVTWQDRRAGSYRVYTQHVTGSGEVDPAWPADGLTVSAATTSTPTAGNAPHPSAVSDGAGGALVTWQDDRAAGVLAVYMQRVWASGVVDPAWPVNGIPVSPDFLGANQLHPAVVSDDAGGGIVFWEENRSGSDLDLFAMRVTAGGVPDPAWYPLGRAVATRWSDQDSACVVSDGHHGALVTFHDQGSLSAARVWSNGLLGSDVPVITSITDVPADQGGFVTLHWNASYYDPDPLHDYTLIQYSVWRMLPPAAQQAAARGNQGRYRATREGARTLYWELLGAVPATGASAYQYTAATFSDSASPPPPYCTFMVVAEAPTAYWASLADSGYSIDNTVPPAPLALQSLFTGTQAQLHWQPVAAPDLRGYRIYADLVPDFPLDPDHFIAQTSGTSFNHAAEIQFFYRVTAVDTHGNESPSVLLTPIALGVDDPQPPAALALYAPRPNPVSRSATLRFVLPAAARARLAIYDASGREVRRLVDGEMKGGEHSVPWDLLDGGGHGVGAGLYFVRLVTGGRSLVQRAVVTR